MNLKKLRTAHLVITLAAFSLALASLASALAQAALRSRSHSNGSLASPLSALAADKGKFRIRVNGQEVGTEEFDIGESASGWAARGATEIHAPGAPSSRVTAKLNLQPDATPLRYEWSIEGAKKASSTIEFQAGKAIVELRLEGARPYTQSFSFPSARIAVLDNNLHHQYEILARLYDWEKKGAQTVSVLVPQELTPGTVTMESLGEQTDNGKKVEALRVHSEDQEINLYFDAGKLVHVVVPSSNAEIIRE